MSNPSPLELRIPPPIVVAITAGAMWIARFLAPPAAPPGSRFVLAAALVVLGVAVAAAGVVVIRRARTTTNPMRPQTASSLVVAGVYRITRNPMYLGLLLVLSGWAVFLWSAWSVIGPLAFFGYMTRFQIIPEETALTSLFGEQYAAYKASVRRWL